MSEQVLVPREPTQAMLRAMCEALGIDADKKPADVLDVLDVQKAAQTLAAYRAMVDVAAPRPGIIPWPGKKDR